ncbi:MAG TPA: HNH endonuclease domain-containing protein, partial [Candidatus Obscuribacterales bacterium]
MVPLQINTTADRLGRHDVRWESLCFRLADDGTGALPTLRHIIVNDNKASTYKLALLRCLTHIAEGNPGMVIARTDEWVEIPLGLVALYWIRIYQPLLLQHNLRQSPGSKGLGFANDGFKSLATISPNDFRVGQALGSFDLRKIMTSALRAASRTIAIMPAHFITWPNTNKQIFQAEAKSPGRQFIGRLDKESLAFFGRLRIPATLWDCLGRYACWVEPAILHEWAQLMQLYNPDQDTGLLHQALAWREGRRDTGLIRNLVDQRLAKHDELRCAWSDRRLTRKNYEVDHYFPWSRWANNDLWNLLPVTTIANASKAEK